MQGTLIQSIKTKILPLGDDVAFMCGHGPGSTIGLERRTNPFLRFNVPAVIEARKAMMTMTITSAPIVSTVPR